MFGLQIYQKNNSFMKNKSKIKLGRKVKTFNAKLLYLSVAQASGGQWTKDEVKQFFEAVVNQLKLAMHTHDTITIIPNLLYLKREFVNKRIDVTLSGEETHSGRDHFTIVPFIPPIVIRNFKDISERILDTDYPYEDSEITFCRDKYIREVQAKMAERSRKAIVAAFEAEGKEVPEKYLIPVVADLSY